MHDYDGFETLSFDISTSDPIQEHIREAAIVRYHNQYLITKINQRSNRTTITAVLDFDEWKDNMYQTYYRTYSSLTTILAEIKPTGWTVVNADSITNLHTLDLEGVNNYDILLQCQATYGVAYEFDNINKILKIIRPETYQSRGLYITDELNLKQLEFKGDSSSLVTRLFAYGKKTETYDEEGNLTDTTYVTIASVNDGKEYVDNNTYSANIITQYWHDDRYEDPQELLEDAVDKLAVLSYPTRSYSCQLIDLSRTNDNYKCLDFKMYDKVTLIDRSSKIKVQHQIVEYTDCPDNPSKNVVSLSSTFKKVTGRIDEVRQSVSDIDTELKRNETSLNELIRTVDRNTLRIEDTYTKGNVDEIITSQIDQVASSISSLVSSVSTINTDIDALTEQLTSQILQNATSITTTLTSIQTITDALTGKMSTSELQKYLRFDEDYLHIGNNQSAFEVVVGPTEIAFMEGERKVAYISNQEFNFNQGVVAEYLKIGTFKISYDAVTGFTIS